MYFTSKAQLSSFLQLVSLMMVVIRSIFYFMIRPTANKRTRNRWGVETGDLDDSMPEYIICERSKIGTWLPWEPWAQGRDEESAVSVIWIKLHLRFHVGRRSAAEIIYWPYHVTTWPMENTKFKSIQEDSTTHQLFGRRSMMERICMNPCLFRPLRFHAFTQSFRWQEYEINLRFSVIRTYRCGRREFITNVRSSGNSDFPRRQVKDNTAFYIQP